MKTVVSSLLLAAALLPACMVRGSGSAYVSGPVAVVEVEEEPPPPRVYVAPPRAGYIYIEGRWVRRGGRWDWQDGRYERHRANNVWVQGRWERRGSRHVWVDGRWNASSGPAHRDHRRDDRPVVRDHRR